MMMMSRLGSSSLLTATLLLLVSGGAGQLTCPDMGCTIACNTVSEVSGTCDKIVELECDGPWTGVFCFDCEENSDEFYFTSYFINVVFGRELSTSSGICGAPRRILGSYYQMSCQDGDDNTATLTVYDAESSDSSSSSKGKSSSKGRGLQMKESPDRTLRRGGKKKKKSSSSSLTEQTCTVAGNSYRRRLKQFDEESLYKGLDDAEFRESSKKHVSFFDEAHKKTIQPCPVRESKLYGQNVSIHECISPENRIAPDTDPDYDKNYQPWIVPNMESATLVAKNPGLSLGYTAIAKFRGRQLVAPVAKRAFGVFHDIAFMDQSDRISIIINGEMNGLSY